MHAFGHGRCQAGRVPGELGAHADGMGIGIVFGNAAFGGPQAGLADVARLGLLDPGDVGRHAGIHRSDDQGRHADPQRGQFGAQTIRGRPGREFGRAVPAHVRHGHDAACRKHIDDRSTPIGFHDRSEGPNHVQNAKEIHFHFPADNLRLVGLVEPFHLEHAGIVDHEGHVGTGLGGCVDLLGSGHIELYGFQALRVARGDGFGIRQIARADIDPRRALIEQFLDKAQSDPAIGAGDDGDAAFGLESVAHEVFQFQL